MIRTGFLFIALLLICSVAQGQVGRRLNDAAKNAAEKAATKHAEKKVEEAVTKAIEDGIEAGNKGLEEADKAIEKAIIEAEESGIEIEIPAEETTKTTSAPKPKPVADIPAKPWSKSMQNVFFPSKKGQTFIYANLNDKGKTDSYTKQVISKVEGNVDNMAITYLSEALDKDRKSITDPPLEVEVTINVIHGVVVFDGSSFAAPGSEGLIEIEGDNILLPSTLAVGEKLKDVKFVMILNMGFKIRTNVLIKDQECLAIEEVTVSAGKFKCHKVTQTTVVGKVTQKIIDWYAPGVGSVKQETYNDKGKLQSSKTLYSIEN
jgi:hypothetical protein